MHFKNKSLNVFGFIFTSVVDLYTFQADTDPGFFLIADPDLDPDPKQKYLRVRIRGKTIRIHNTDFYSPSNTGT